MLLARHACFCLAIALGFDASAQSIIPALQARVTDLTATLTPDQITALERSLQSFEEKKGSQIAILIVPTIEPESIEQYSLRVVEQWKLGRKKVDDGALLIIAKDDRSLRIEVGYGLEGALNDAVSKRIISEIITPKFRQGDFYQGITDGIEQMQRVIEGEPLPPAERTKQDSERDLESFIPVIFILVLIVGSALRALLGRFPGAIVTAGITAFLAWMFIGAISIAIVSGILTFLFTLLGGGMRGLVGGHHGGGFGGGRNGGGGGGGFSGGGGGFGGGGASGRW
jgi:uncharacterized protein